MTIQQPTLCIFGFGYSARPVSVQLIERGWRVLVTARDARQADAYSALGVHPIRLDKPIPRLPDKTHFLITAAPGEEVCPALSVFHDQAAAFASVTYLSTTGVYGDRGGGWVFEWTPVAPMSSRAMRRVTAERAWAACCARSGVGFRTVRLPGIYGPGRAPFSRLRAGKAKCIIKPGQVFSRIHRDDLASGLVALLMHGNQFGVFHLCDDGPAPPQDVTAYAAHLAGLSLPPELPFEAAQLSPMAASFYSECKRVSNARAKSALGWRPAFPTYREGLGSVLLEETVKMD